MYFAVVESRRDRGVALSIYLNPLSSVLVMGRQIVRLRYMLYD